MTHSKLRPLTELPRLPGHRSAMFRDVQIQGVTVRVHKARSDRTVSVSARLSSMLSDELYRLLAHSEEEDKAGPLRGILGIDFEDDTQIKNAMIGHILPILYEKIGELSEESGPGSLFWYFERILAGNVEYEGARPDSMSDLDEMGFGVADLTRLFWAGIELACFPTRGDPDTSPGDRESGEPRTNPARGTSSTRVESARMTGRAARTSTATG